MSNLLTGFQAKVDEINKYFEFVQFLDTYVVENNSTLKTESRPDFTIDSNLEKVLRGNCYLMLYNLVEGSITESINAIFIDINQSNISYHQLTPIYKRIWLKYKYHLVDFVKSETDQAKYHKKLETNLPDALQNLDIFKIHTFSDKDGNLFEDYSGYLKVIDVSDISGNLDARKIRDDLSKIYDFDVPDRCNELVAVKNARNKLAHGEITFSEAGLKNTIPELIAMKGNVVDYLRDVLTNVDTFIKRKGYKTPLAPFKFSKENIKY
jgi:MAE_28990/MAE_18760-like HEPN